MSERTAPPGQPNHAESRPSLTERMHNALSSVTKDSDTREAKPAPAKAAKGKPTRAPRRAQLRLTRVDPWSVAKTSFLLSVAFGVATFVAIFMVWTALGVAGVWDSINTAVASIVESDTSEGTFDVTDYIGMSRVLGFTLIVSILNVILLTAIATLTAFLYNLAAALLGGIDVTLAEDPR
jgi:hypothetical protein